MFSLGLQKGYKNGPVFQQTLLAMLTQLSMKRFRIKVYVQHLNERETISFKYMCRRARQIYSVPKFRDTKVNKIWEAMWRPLFKDGSENRMVNAINYDSYAHNAFSERIVTVHIAYVTVIGPRGLTW